MVLDQGVTYPHVVTSADTLRAGLDESTTVARDEAFILGNVLQPSVNSRCPPCQSGLGSVPAFIMSLSCTFDLLLHYCERVRTYFDEARQACPALVM